MTETIRSAPHYNVAQLRHELWNQLKTATTALARTRSGSARHKDSLAAVTDLLKQLATVEAYFAFPGVPRVHALQHAVQRGEYTAARNQTAEMTRQLVGDAYRQALLAEDEEDTESSATAVAVRTDRADAAKRRYFEVLWVEDLSVTGEANLRDQLRQIKDRSDPFSYDMIVQRSFQDALIALQFNSNIQAVVVCYAPPYRSAPVPDIISPYLSSLLNGDHENTSEAMLGPLLGRLIRQFRPEIDVYYVTDTALSNLKDSTLSLFRRIFYHREDVQDLHLAIHRGIRERYETPFFTALKDYSRKPTGVFHAMPFSRGNSVFRSHWISDFGDFYGRNLFLAETSSTTGGLDSLLQPTGSLKKAQEMAATAYGAQSTFFVTNGTSTANKIVMQALVEPGDLVLIDRDCHKSHHYGLVLMGALPVYLDSYPVLQYSMYGAVPMAHIREKLLQLREAGRLDKVKMMVLTNCTFDGLVYNVERVMQAVLAIKPDMVFLWDEAWFAFAGFTHTYRQRTGMFVAEKLHERYHSSAYRKQYEEHIGSLEAGQEPSLPDPDQVQIRVYATQSTHKTLSSFRQGSMIHVWDEQFRRHVTEAFQEAYMTHTSTSPNYQLLASLDAGRRQVQFEGFELVERAIEMAMTLRARINDHPNLRKYFDVLTVRDLIPDEYRESGLGEYYTPEQSWNRMEGAWERDDFVLDPTKITLGIGRTGVDGDTFKNRYLMDQFNIQVNKTSRNSVLLMTNIGTTRGSVVYLVNVLLRVAEQLDEQFEALSQRESQLAQRRIHELTMELPALPDFSHFHAFFQAVPGVPGGNIREAYFLAHHEENCEYLPLTRCLKHAQDGDRELVSTSFVIPYPPGFPVLVPGQVLSLDIVSYLLALDVKEIHGYRPELGLSVFRDSALQPS